MFWTYNFLQSYFYKSSWTEKTQPLDFSCQVVTEWVKNKVSHPENLVALLQALLSSWAVLQHSGYKDAHVIPPSQPQPHTFPLPELNQLHAWPEEETNTTVRLIFFDMKLTALHPFKWKCYFLNSYWTPEPLYSAETKDNSGLNLDI